MKMMVYYYRLKWKIIETSQIQVPRYLDNIRFDTKFKTVFHTNRSDDDLLRQLSGRIVI